MVEIADIKDRDSLRAWLEGQPKEASVWIARRAALRVFPFLWDWTVTPEIAKKYDLTTLSFLRLFLISEVARKMLTSEIIAAADAATNTAINAAAAAYGATNAAAAYGAAAAAATNAATNAADAADTAWNSIRADCEAVATGADLDHLPLWAGRENPLASEWANLKQQLTASGPHRSDETARGSVTVDWSFWVKWYDSVLAGEPLNWDMLEEIALIKSEEWEKGPARVNLLIGEIEVRFAL